MMLEASHRQDDVEPTAIRQGPSALAKLRYGTRTMTYEEHLMLQSPFRRSWVSPNLLGCPVHAGRHCGVWNGSSLMSRQQRKTFVQHAYAVYNEEMQ